MACANAFKQGFGDPISDFIPIRNAIYYRRYRVIVADHCHVARIYDCICQTIRPIFLFVNGLIGP